MGVPGAFIGHYRRVDRARDFCQSLDTLHRLLEIDQIVSLHAAKRANGLPDCAVALIGIDTELNCRADRLPDPAYQFDIAIRLDTDLDLDGANAFAHCLRRLALRFLKADEADGVRDRNLPAERAAKEPMHGEAALLAG